jgi:hypothetical protein
MLILTSLAAPIVRSVQIGGGLKATKFVVSLFVCTYGQVKVVNEKDHQTDANVEGRT